ncbi:ABC transporter permease [Paracoccaceae bacterium GXU_MW_L88]
MICLLPMVAAALAALGSDLATWRDVLASVLPRYTRTTLALVAVVSAATIVIGSLTAWLVTVYRFPGRAILEIFLALPLAFPSFVLAYAYTDLLDFPGPVQTLLRDLTGWTVRDYWFPEVRSFGGAAAMLSFVLYPYVYLLARASFRQQSAAAYMVARTLGQTPTGAFLRVALPMARPAIAGGALLVVMETIADFGTVAFFNVQTFSTGIYQAWFSLGDRGAAAQLSLVLLLFALLVAGLERAQRGRARMAAQGQRFGDMDKVELHGLKAWGATALCTLPVLTGFVIPLIMLGVMADRSRQSLFSSRYLELIQNSLSVAAIAAVLTVLGAMMIALRSRIQTDRLSRGVTLIAGLGYAVPGAVIAVGLLVPFAALDNLIDRFMEARFGIDTGLLITGSIWLLVLAYMTRFMAAALNAFESGLMTVPPSFDAVGRSLGRSWGEVVRAVHLPMTRTSIVTALIIVYVDVMKELPATLILHPFDFQTLAVQAHRLAADERLAEAALPSLVLVGFGLIPVALLCRTIGQEGARASKTFARALRTQ